MFIYIFTLSHTFAWKHVYIYIILVLYIYLHNLAPVLKKKKIFLDGSYEDHIYICSFIYIFDENYIYIHNFNFI